MTRERGIYEITKCKMLNLTYNHVKVNKFDNDSTDKFKLQNNTMSRIDSLRYDLTLTKVKNDKITVI